MGFDIEKAENITSCAQIVYKMKKDITDRTVNSQRKLKIYKSIFEIERNE